MSNTQPPPLPPQHRPSNVSSSPLAPPILYEYAMAFNKPLTKEEKCAWLGEIAHLVLTGVLPQSVYPILRDKIDSLPEVLPSKDRPEEKLPGSDYIHPGPPKPYSVLLRMFEDNKPIHVPDAPKTASRRKQNESDNSAAIFVFITALFFLGLGGFGIYHLYMNSPWKKDEGTGAIALAAPEMKPIALKPKTDNPFEDERDLTAPVGELEKEVLRITLRISCTEKCTYKIEKTRKPLPESYEGQPVRLFKNAKTWRDKEGTFTTIHDFKNRQALDNFIVHKYTKGTVTVDESAGRLVIQHGPEKFHPQGIMYTKISRLPIEIIADIEDTGFPANSYASDITFVFNGKEVYGKDAATASRYGHGFRFNYDGRRFYVFWKDIDANNKIRETLIHEITFDNFQSQGEFDIPKGYLFSPFVLESHPLILGLECRNREDLPDISRFVLRRIITKGRFYGEELNENLQVRLFDTQGVELKNLFDGSEALSPDLMRKPYLYKDQRLFIESCLDPKSGLTVYRVDSPYLESENIDIGFLLPKEKHQPKITLGGCRATIDCRDEKILIGWSDKEASIELQPRKTLKVIHAKYGANDKWIDMTEKARGYLVDNTLNYQLNGAVISDLARNVKKTLVLTYSLDGEEKTETFFDRQMVQVQAHPQYRFARSSSDKKRSFEFVVAEDLETLPDKLPTFEEAKRNNPFASENPSTTVRRNVPIAETYGPELLAITEFKNGYLPSQESFPKNKSCRWGIDPKAGAEIRNIDDCLVIKCRTPPIFHSVALSFYLGSTLQSSKKYLLEIEAKTDSPSRIYSKICSMDEKVWVTENVDRTSTEWKTYKKYFKPQKNASLGKFDLYMGYPDVTFEIRRVSLREVLDGSTDNPFKEKEATDNPFLSQNRSSSTAQ